MKDLKSHCPSYLRVHGSEGRFAEYNDIASFAVRAEDERRCMKYDTASPVTWAIVQANFEPSRSQGERRTQSIIQTCEGEKQHPSFANKLELMASEQEAPNPGAESTNTSALPQCYALT